MRILFIGNAGRKFNGERYYGFDTRFYNGLARNGHCVHFFSDRDEALELRPLGLRGLGVKRANEKLLKVAKTFRPDAVVMAHATMISNDTVREMKAMLPHLRVAHLNVDAIFNPATADKLKSRAEVADASFVTTAGAALDTLAAAGGSPFYFLPNVTDASIDTGRAFGQEAPEYDLACFMRESRNPADDAARVPLALAVQKRLPELKTHYRGFGGAPVLRGPGYIEGCGNAAMALNLSKTVCEGHASTPGTRCLYSSDRLAHIMGNGSLAFIHECFGLEELLGETAVFFGSEDELVEKAGFYKNNPAARRKLAQAGWEKAHRDFNETVTMQYVLERLFDKALSRDYAWPTRKHESTPHPLSRREREGPVAQATGG